MKLFLAFALVVALLFTGGCSIMSNETEAEYKAISFAGDAAGFDFDEYDRDLVVLTNGNIYSVNGVIKRDHDKQHFDMRAKVELLPDIKKWRCNLMMLDGILLYKR